MKTARRLRIALLLLLAAAAAARAQLPLGPQFQVNPVPTPDLMSPRVAINAGGEFITLWYGFGGSSGGILHARRYFADGTPATGELQVADQIVSTNENLDVAIQDDGSFLVLFSVAGALKVRRFGPDGTLLLDELVASGSPYVPEASLSSGSGGRFVVAWSLFGGEVFARVFSPDGAPLGPVVLVDTTSEAKFGPRVAMGGQGDFVVVWQPFLGGDPSGRLLANIQARRYGPGSRLRGETILVSDHYGASIRVAKDGAGNFLVMWAELPSVNGLHGIYGRRFSAGGVPLSAAMPLVSSLTTGYETLAMAPDGTFVLAWGGLFHGMDVFAQVFAADGVPPRPAFLAPQIAIGTQRAPAVAINGMGRFVVVWDHGDLFARRFKARRQ